MGYLPSNCDVAEQSRLLELQDNEDVVPILIFERKRKTPKDFEDSPLLKKRTRFEQEETKLTVASRKRKLQKDFEECPLPKKIPKFEQEQMVAQLPGVVKSVRSGKWMIFLNKKKVDQIWRKVKILMAENELGNEAKVTRLASDRHLISLYTYDFEDVQDLFRVLVSIRRNHLSDGYLHYKMDKPKHQGLCTATDQSTQCAGFGSAKKQQPGEKLSIYSSPPPQTNNPRGTENDFVQLFLNNVEPGNKKGLVAEMRKDFGGVELKEIFYNPPQVLVQPNAVDVSVQGSRVGLNETNSKRFEKLQASGNIVTFKIDLNRII